MIRGIPLSASTPQKWEVNFTDAFSFAPVENMCGTQCNKSSIYGLRCRNFATDSFSDFIIGIYSSSTTFCV